VERGIAVAGSLLVERGLEVMLLQSTQPTGPHRFEVTTLGPGNLGPFGRRIRNRVIDLTALPTRRLDAILAASGADVVHTHNLPGLTTAVWAAARRQRIPIIHSIHDYYLLCPRLSLMSRRGEFCGDHPLCKLRTRRLARWADAVSVVTGVSESVLDVHRHLFPTSRQEVLRNPMVAFDRDELRPPSATPLTVGYIGGLTHEKGIEELLDAVTELRGDGRFRFRIGGHGRLAPLVAERAEQLPNLTFDGLVRAGEKQAFIDRCDVGIIPSVWAEPGGPTHVLAEWLTAGRPTLVSLRGGLAEVVTGKGAIAIEPTQRGIVDALLELADPERWERALSERGTWDGAAELDRWIGRQIELYEELASRSAPALP
jgi:glycosyltransferase involved in cell wall biosynthesis